MNKFLEAIHDMIEIITGERPEEPKPKKRKELEKKMEHSEVMINLHLM